MISNKQARSALVELSGGVDSAVAARLLLSKGWQVQGVYLDMLPDSLGTDALKAAERIAGKLGIEFHVLDLHENFQDEIIEYFCRSYLAGITPNPCVICNPRIKVSRGLEFVKELGLTHLATGHYARILPCKKGYYGLFSGRDRSKDQSYFLHRLPRSSLANIVFPLGEWTKVQTKEYAARVGLAGLVLSESQEVCFLKGDYRQFFGDRAEGLAVPGEIVDMDGRILGTHTGLYSYTVGQRRGLGIPDASPYYVVRLDTRNNRLVIGKDRDLWCNKLTVTDIHWLVPSSDMGKKELLIKIRYRHRGCMGTIHMMNYNRARISFLEPQRAVTPGQFAVFYRGEQVLGGGVICG